MAQEKHMKRPIWELFNEMAPVNDAFTLPTDLKPKQQDALHLVLGAINDEERQNISEDYYAQEQTSLTRIGTATNVDDAYFYTIDHYIMSALQLVKFAADSTVHRDGDEQCLFQDELFNDMHGNTIVELLKVNDEVPRLRNITKPQTEWLRRMKSEAQQFETGEPTAADHVRDMGKKFNSLRTSLGALCDYIGLQLETIEARPEVDTALPEGFQRAPAMSELSKASWTMARAFLDEAIEQAHDWQSTFIAPPERSQGGGRFAS